MSQDEICLMDRTSASQQIQYKSSPNSIRRQDSVNQIQKIKKRENIEDTSSLCRGSAMQNISKIEYKCKWRPQLAAKCAARSRGAKPRSLHLSHNKEGDHLSHNMVMEGVFEGDQKIHLTHNMEGVLEGDQRVMPKRSSLRPTQTFFWPHPVLLNFIHLFFSLDLGSQPVEEMLGLKLLCAGKAGSVEVNQGVSTGYYPADKTGGVQLTGVLFRSG